MAGKYPCLLAQILEELAKRFGSSKLASTAGGAKSYYALPRCNQCLDTSLSTRELIELLDDELKRVIRHLPQKKKRYIDTLRREIQDECQIPLVR